MLYLVRTKNPGAAGVLFFTWNLFGGVVDGCIKFGIHLSFTHFVVNHGGGHKAYGGDGEKGFLGGGLEHCLGFLFLLVMIMYKAVKNTRKAKNAQKVKNGFTTIMGCGNLPT